MDTVVFFTTLIVILKSTSSLRCYKCDASDVTPRKDLRLCRYMNESDLYKTDCPESTFCYKKITYMRIGNEKPIEGIERGCAKQTWDGNQKKEGRHWRNINPVYEDAYTAGCFDDPSNGERAANRVHCYCNGDYCNGGQRGGVGAGVVGLCFLGMFLGSYH